MFYRLALLIITLALVTGCQMATNVKNLGGDTYQVGAVSCPACGGPSNSERIALEKANEFCSKSGKTAVAQDMRSGAFNGLGGGDTDLIFKCTENFSVDDHKECIDTAALELSSKFGDDGIKVVNRLIATNGGFGFEQLSDQTYPNSSEKEAILNFGGSFEKCWLKAIAVSSPADQLILKRAINSTLVLMADLSASKISYGEYAKSINTVIDSAMTSVSALEKEAMLRRQQEQAQRSEMLQNTLNSFQPKQSTNCTSTTTGNITHTNCY